MQDAGGREPALRRGAGDTSTTSFPARGVDKFVRVFFGGDLRIRAAVWIAALVALTCSVASRGAEETPLLAHSPTLSKTQVVVAYGGYLWSVAREGGDARQLTTGGHEGAPVFSPDGKWIAFTGQYDGNIDVFVIPAEGGEPKRLTWHPGADIADSWTPDGKKVLFHSNRESYADFDRLYTVSVEGGPAEALPMWRGEAAWLSPDGTSIAYCPTSYGKLRGSAIAEDRPRRFTSCG